MSRTEAERLITDIVAVTGELVHERRLAIAQMWIDSWNGQLANLQRMLDRSEKLRATEQERVSNLRDEVSEACLASANLAARLANIRNWLP